MAYRMNKPEVGMNVYEPYHPTRAGVVTTVRYKKLYGYQVRVLWLSGETTEVVSSYLSDFDELIADHRKKLATHLKTLDRLKGLIY